MTNVVVITVIVTAVKCSKEGCTNDAVYIVGENGYCALHWIPPVPIPTQPSEPAQ